MLDQGWILVGITDDSASHAAVVYAAHAAARTDRRLRIVHAAPSEGRPGDASRSGAMAGAALLDRAVSEAGWYLSEERIRAELVMGDPRRGVAELASSAGLVVLGHASAATAKRRSRGSLVSFIASRAPVPVVAVPDVWAPSEPRGQLVVGLKRADLIPVALVRGAVEIARSRSAALLIVHVREPHVDDAPAEQIEHDIRQRIGSLLTEQTSPRVDVEVRIGDAEDVLAELSGQADLVIIGRRARQLPGDGFGHTGHALLASAACPVMVLPVAEEPEARPVLATAQERG